MCEYRGQMPLQLVADAASRETISLMATLETSDRTMRAAERAAAEAMADKSVAEAGRATAERAAAEAMANKAVAEALERAAARDLAWIGTAHAACKAVMAPQTTQSPKSRSGGSFIASTA